MTRTFKALRFFWRLLTLYWLRQWFRVKVTHWLDIDFVMTASIRDCQRLDVLERRVSNITGFHAYLLFTGKLKIPKRHKDEGDIWVDYAWAEKVEQPSYRYSSSGNTSHTVSATYQPRIVEEITLLCGEYEITHIKVGNLDVHHGSAWPVGRPFKVPERLQELDVGVNLTVMLEKL